MNMIDGWMIGPGLLGGIVIGLIFFGGLHWTISRLADAQQPVTLVLGSFVIRSVIALAGFYLVAGDRWERVIAAAVGFWLARAGMVFWLRASDRQQTGETR